MRAGPSIFQAREAARVELLPTDPGRAETVAFDVLVDGAIAGIWVATADGGGKIKWTQGETVETGDCDSDRDKIIAAIRPSIPGVRLRFDRRHDQAGGGE